MRVSAPPFLNPCYYGTDIDSQESLIACHHTVSEIAQIIGADSLGYLRVDHAALLASGNHGKGFCTACFSGDYPTQVPIQTQKNRFESKISERSDES
jgi:amidophosphoribosyltransferase